jgi:hypothetical protein
VVLVISDLITPTQVLLEEMVVAFQGDDKMIMKIIFEI